VSALQVEIAGIERTRGRLTASEAAALCRRALEAAGILDGHAALEFVGRDRIRTLNREHRARDATTDVLSFPVDGAGEVAGPRELGDVIICPQEVDDLREAVVHGALHLAGMDHETDRGQMLALQRKVLAAVGG
jgi:probable rRNA maturation factor